MRRALKIKTPKQEMSRVIEWADTQGFINIADALRRVYPFIWDEPSQPPKTKQ